MKNTNMKNTNLFKKIGIFSIFEETILLIFLPALTFLFAYVGGMLLDWFVGVKLVDGLNLMFDTTRFTRDLIPLTCATLATIGRYFIR